VLEVGAEAAVLRETELGEFPRSSRARLDPSEVGLPVGASGRRVAGLRREEVAVLATNLDDIERLAEIVF
jgi:hypothetical protein